MASVSDKLREYQLEVYKKKISTGLFATIITVVTIFLIMLFSGDRFNRYLAYFGLEGISNVAGGVYADCSLPENRNNAYCLKKSEQKNEEWKKLVRGGTAPFSLNKK